MYFRGVRVISNSAKQVLDEGKGEREEWKRGGKRAGANLPNNFRKWATVSFLVKRH